jgi:hypothetical protein
MTVAMKLEISEFLNTRKLELIRSSEADIITVRTAGTQRLCPIWAVRSPPRTGPRLAEAHNHARGLV